MYAWIIARRIKRGMMEEFLRAWQDPGIPLPVSPSSPAGPTVYALQPTDDPDVMWGIGFFDTLGALEGFRTGPEIARRAEALAPYVEETLWERTLLARSWGEADQPLAYGLYIQTTPRGRYQLACICPDARDVIRQADAFRASARERGYPEPEWTMRAYADADDAPMTLGPDAGHAHHAGSRSA